MPFFVVAIFWYTIWPRILVTSMEISRSLAVTSEPLMVIFPLLGLGITVTSLLANDTSSMPTPTDMITELKLANEHASSRCTLTLTESWLFKLLVMYTALVAPGIAA